MNEVDRIGVDVGFGASKLVWLDKASKLRSLVIHSVLGRGATVRNMDLGLGGPARQRVFRLSYQGEEYLVGVDALLHSAVGVASRQDFGRIGSDEERILLLALLAKAGLTEVAIVTGLPVLAWDRRHALRRSWQGEHQVTLGRKEMTIVVHEVRTAWQPVLSLYDYALTVEDGVPKLAGGMDNGKLTKGWAVVDVGQRTTDVAGVIGLVPVDKYSGGSLLGGLDLLTVVSKAIMEEWGIHRPLAEIEQAVRRGSIDIYDQEVDLIPLAESATASVAAQVVTEISALLGDGSQFYGILLTGGPAPLLRPALMSAYPRNLILLADSQIANARGACKFAQGPVFKLDYNIEKGG